MTENVVVPAARPDETPKERRARVKLEKRLAEQAALDAKMARYRTLRANVRRRRAFYIVSILLAIAVLAATVWDIVFNASDLKWPLLAAYVALFVLGIIALISRRRHLQEVLELAELRRVFLEDPASGDIFELTSSRLPDLQGVEFTSPTTGQFYRVPSLDSAPVERNIPAGSSVARQFDLDGIDVEIATYGTAPRDVEFRRPAPAAHPASS